MDVLRKLWPGRPDTAPRDPLHSSVSDADIDVIETATSYVLRGEQVPYDVMQDIRRIRKTGFFLADGMRIPPRVESPE